MRILLFFAGLLTTWSVALGHARWLPGASLNVRGGTNASPGIKTGPCGGVARGTATQLTAGQTITVEWEETIEHPGRYLISFSEKNDTNFTELKRVEDTKNGSNDLPHRYSTTITVPNVNCTACTMQLIQVMTENPAAPRNYYSCADIAITGANPNITTTTTTTKPGTSSGDGAIDDSGGTSATTTKSGQSTTQTTCP
jgi:hypothetical protein